MKPDMNPTSAAWLGVVCRRRVPLVATTVDSITSPAAAVAWLRQEAENLGGLAGDMLSYTADRIEREIRMLYVGCGDVNDPDVEVPREA